MFSAVTGGIVRKELSAKNLKREIAILKDGWQEYEDRVKLLLAQKADHEKTIAEHDAFCKNFDQLIGPFEQQYDTCKVMAGRSRLARPAPRAGAPARAALTGSAPSSGL